MVFIGNIFLLQDARSIDLARISCISWTKALRTIVTKSADGGTRQESHAIPLLDDKFVMIKSDDDFSATPIL